MPRLRFETVSALFEAYPFAGHELAIDPNDEPALEVLKTLAGDEKRLDEAVGLCAYLLPRRDAVWWGCQCVNRLAPPSTEDEQAPLRAAADWVNVSEKEHRLAAFDAGSRGDPRQAGTWLAFAAGFAGPHVPAAGGGWVATERDQTARAVRAAVLIAAARADPERRAELLRQCIAEGARLLADEPADA